MSSSFNNLSVRAKNVCTQENIHSKQDLIDFIQKNGINSIFRFRNCGRKTAQELIELYKTDEINENINNELDTTNEPENTFYRNLTIRAKNVCSREGIYSEGDLKDYVQKNGVSGLYKLKNCGKKTVLELIRYYESLQSNTTVDVKVNNYSTVLNSQNRRKLLKVNFDLLFRSLSIRSKNIIKSKYGEVVDIFLFTHNEIIRKISLFDFSNPHLKSKLEIEKLISDLERLIQDLDSKPYLDNEDISFIELALALELDPLSHDLKSFISGGSFSILKFINNYIIEKSLLLPLEDILYLKNYAHYPIDNIPQEVRTLISEKMFLSIERVRQKLVQASDRLPKVLSGYKAILKFHNHYKSYIDKEYLFFSNHEISNYEDLTIESEYLKLVNYIGLLLSDSHHLIQVNTELKKLRTAPDYEFYKEYKKFKVNLLVSKSFITKKMLLHEMIKLFKILVDKRKTERIYTIDNDSLGFEQKVFLIELAARNFNLKKESRLSVVIPSNKQKKITDVLIEILETANQPLSLDEIFKIYKKTSGRKIKDEVDNQQSIMSSLGRAKNIVVLRGALSSGKSLYGLKKWEDEGRIISGSIVDLSLWYLKKSRFPIHPLELSRFITKHRQTNIKNILTNLKLNQKHEFIFFEGGFIGLKSKEYPKEFISSLTRTSPYQSITLISFLRNHKYYNYREFVTKFSEEFGLKAIQIEWLLQGRINQNQLKLRGENIYYSSSNADKLISEIFNIETYDLSGFNPYRIEINGVKTICLVNESSYSNYNQKDNNDLLESIKRENWDFLIFIETNIDSQSLRVCIETRTIYDSNQFLESWDKFESHIMRVNKLQFNLNEYFKIYDTIEHRILGLEYSVNNTYRIEMVRNRINIDKLSEIESISEIINLIFQIEGKDISMTEARKIFSVIKYG